MAAVVRSAGCPWVLMHWRGHSADMQSLAGYGDVVADVRAELGERVDAALAAGVAPEQLVLDPGLGFAKTAAHNWALLANLDAIMSLGLPVLVAASRKSFLGRLLAAPDPAVPGVHIERPTDQREDATTAITAHCAWNGVWGIRTHEVRASVDAALTIAAIQTHRGPPR